MTTVAELKRRLGLAVGALVALTLPAVADICETRDFEGTGYAVWVGIGASLTVVWAMITGREKASTARILLILLLVACVVGLKVVS